MDKKDGKTKQRCKNNKNRNPNVSIDPSALYTPNPNFRNAYITENRIYKNPDNPDISPYDIAFATTLIQAVVDAETGKSLEEILESIGDIDIDLSNLDVPVSSRAPANTALSTAVWNNARAAALDQITAARMANLDAAISSRAAANIVGAMNATSATAVNDVTTLMGYAKGILAHLLTNLATARMSNLDASISSRAPANTSLSNSIWTDALASALSALSTGGTARVNIRVQRGRIAAPASTDPIDITISSVVMSRSFVLLDFTHGSTNNTNVSIQLQSSTNVRIHRSGSTASALGTVSWQVITFD